MSQLGNRGNLVRDTYRDQITRLLRESILRGEMPPDSPLSASRLAKELGVSRGPIRESLLELQREGLVVQETHQTARVTTLDPLDAWEIYSVRGSLESLAVRLGFARLDNESLMAVIDQLSEVANRMSGVSIDDLPATLELDLEFHAKIRAISGNCRLMEIHKSLDPLMGALFMFVRARLSGTSPEIAHGHVILVDRLRRIFDQGDVAAAQEAIWAHYYNRVEPYLPGPGLGRNGV